MKMWKKTMAMLMCATMAVGSFAACNKDGDSSSNDSTPTPPAPPAPTAEELATAAAEAYVNGAIDTLKNAKSFKVVINVNNKDVTDYFGEDGETVDPELQETDEGSSTVEIILSQDGDGVAIHTTEIEVDTYNYDDEETGAEIEVTNTNVNETIMKGGVEYSRYYYYDDSMTADEIAAAKAEKWNKYTEAEEGAEGEMAVTSIISEELIQKLLDTKEVEDAYNMLIDALTGELKTKILSETVADGNFVWEYDFADEVNAILAYIEGIDETKDTLGKVVNEVLAEVAPGLTAEALIGQLKAYSKMTVADALKNIDTMLAEYETSLQGIKDAIFNSEIMGVLLTDEGILAATGLDAATIQSIKDWKFASLQEAGNEVGSAIVGELINGLLLQQGIVEAPEEGEEPIDYVAQFLAEAEANLAMTFEELGMEMPDMAGNLAKKLEGTYGVSFDTTSKALKTINFSFYAELVSYEEDYNEATDEYDLVVGYYTQIIDMDITVSEISASTVTINAPAEADIYADAEA